VCKDRTKLFVISGIHVCLTLSAFCRVKNISWIWRLTNSNEQSQLFLNGGELFLNGVHLGHPGLMVTKKSGDHSQHVLLIGSMGSDSGGRFCSATWVFLKFILERPGVCPKGQAHVVKSVCSNQTGVVLAVRGFPREMNIIMFKYFAQEDTVR